MMRQADWAERAGGRRKRVEGHERSPQMYVVVTVYAFSFQEETRQ